MTFVPLRDGPTVWEIGFPDRTATGYFVPDVNPMYVNKLFLNSPEKQADIAFPIVLCNALSGGERVKHDLYSTFLCTKI